VNQWHYWFLSLLLAFFIVFVFLHGMKKRWLRNPANSSNSEPAKVKSILRVLFVCGILTSEGYLSVSLFVPDMSWFTIDLLLQFQPTHLVFYFALGVFAYSRQWFKGDEFPRRLSIWVPVGLLLAVGFLVTGQSIFSNPVASHQLSAALLALFSLFRSFLCLAFLVMMIAFALRYRNRLSPFNQNLAANSYNIYLVHLVFIVMFQDILMVWPAGPPMAKAGIVFLSALLISYGISRLINRFPRAFAIFLLGLFILVVVVGQ
jgi:surface polysaccharide O-acyltransferase-like enzyme